MRQLFPASQPDRKPSEVYSVPELAFPSEGLALADRAEERRPYTYFNMVSSVDGKAVSAAGNAGGLGSPTDHYLMSRLRAAADAVLVGAETFRRDPFLPLVKPDLAHERTTYFPANPQPWGVVLSRDGNLPLDKKFFEVLPRQRRLIALGSQASQAAQTRLAERAAVVRVPDRDGQPDVAWLLAYLYRELGIRRLLCEGGPTLNYSFFSQNLADELFWTLAPKLVGSGKQGSSILNGPGAGFPLDQMPRLDLVSLYEEDSELFFRYRVAQN